MYVKIKKFYKYEGIDDPYWFIDSFETDVIPNVGEMFEYEISGPKRIYKIIDKKYKVLEKTFGKTLGCDLIVEEINDL